MSPSCCHCHCCLFYGNNVLVKLCRRQRPPLSPRKAPCQSRQACPLQTQTWSDPGQSSTFHQSRSLGS